MVVHNARELIFSLINTDSETECLEFKVNNGEPDSIGKYISALSNSAILTKTDKAYLIFGIKDQTHEIVGTNLDLKKAKKGNDTLLHYLNKSLSPAILIEHFTETIDSKKIEGIAISPPFTHPVRFRGISYIRIDSSLHKLSDHPRKEAELWQAVSRNSFESSVAKYGVSQQEIFDAFDVQKIVELLSAGRSTGDMISYLEQEKLIEKNPEGGFNISNMLVLLAAKNFGNWQGMEHKGIRVIQYKDKSKINSSSDKTGKLGYLVAMDGAVAHIMDKINKKEELQHGIRRDVYDIPKVAIREILANAIVHQDLSVKDSGPKVEIFTDRVVITNPGESLVDPKRFVDAPSKSRNENFANVLRRAGLCEARGSGIDRAFDAIEEYILPPPHVKVVECNTVVTLYGPNNFSNMSTEDRVLACYWHAALCVERNDYMSNSSLRTRFGLSEKQYGKVSDIIRDATDAGLIKPLRENQANRNARYVPIWH